MRLILVRPFLCVQDIYIGWANNDHKRSTVFLSGDIEPASKRGGLAGEFLSILPMGDFQPIIKPDVNTSPSIFFIQQLSSADQVC
ncbi:unnamed protein product [Rotaria magnacalcarata]|uniref:Uncharacterized protein n=1 Tax=Rotaria magnacalcarata TaxID=392030 RepID=A0A8S3G852_9BILA|nr:unnamed protein product [Rotaria magnacalcarata]